MNKQELLAAAEVMRKAAEGEVVEMKAKPDESWNVAKYVSIWNWNAGDYRILDFPVPPCGQTWHNPAGLTATQVGVHEGWRLMLLGEIIPMDAEFTSSYAKGEWVKASHAGDKCTEDNATNRTKSPLPVADPVEEAFKKYQNQALAFFPDWQSFVAGWNAAKEHENNQKNNK